MELGFEWMGKVRKLGIPKRRKGAYTSKFYEFIMGYEGDNPCHLKISKIFDI